MDSILDKLKKAGLSGNESKIYLELLKRGSISASSLAKKMGMDRTLVYQILNNLIDKGLVNYINKENRRYYEATSPDCLLAGIKERENIVMSVIPDLKKIERQVDVEQKINIYEGKNGIRLLMEDVMQSADVCVFGASGKSFDIIPYDMPSLIRKSLKTDMKVRMITDKEFKGHSMTKLPNISVRYLEEVKSPATTTIYGDTVAINVSTDKPIVIFIKNRDVSESYKNYFEFLWKKAGND
ncbi:MAG: winged helix-turn-helix transcriptional regulator [Candidatus Aenigmarchaeota archaeon]|nr:winged helix-turn-helix transcriptional regulator [Candidatus Aenigmarchaeota archaeon]